MGRLEKFIPFRAASFFAYAVNCPTYKQIIFQEFQRVCKNLSTKQVTYLDMFNEIFRTPCMVRIRSIHSIPLLISSDLLDAKFLNIILKSFKLSGWGSIYQIRYKRWSKVMSNVNETPEVGSYISFLFLLLSAPAALKMENRRIESFAYQLHVYWLGTTTAHHTCC